MRKIYSTLLLLLIANFTLQAKTVRVLFLGNSYTNSNNLPQIISNLAASTGDTLIYQDNTPGGYTFNGHSTNPTSLSLIAAGNWDYVVLQEQSQLPSFPDGQVASQVYPYAAKLDSLIKAHNPCAKTMFYMTWGRQNGDASNCDYFPLVCTYEGMDSLLQARYTIMAETHGASLSPVAPLWRNLRENYPHINLYTADQSHPNNQGSFAAACAFYTMIFEKDPSLSAFNYTVDATNANIIKEAAKEIVYDSMAYWNRFIPTFDIDFDFTIDGNTVTFTNESEGTDTYLWIFGDGNTSNEVNPNHEYAEPGTYEVALITGNFDCPLTLDTLYKTVTIGSTHLENVHLSNALRIFPNPVHDQLNIHSDYTITSIEVYNLLGQLVEKMSHSSNQITINSSKWINGIYLIKVQQGDQWITRTIIK